MSEDSYLKTQILSRPPSSIMAPPALLYCVDTSVLRDGVGARISLGGEGGDRVITVGRDEKNQVALHAQGVSRNHARVFQHNGDWMVEDLGSTNGTRINNSKVDGKQPLNDGDTVAFGRACYKFQLVAAGATSGIDIDLGGTEQTMIIQPAQTTAAAEDPTKPDSVSAPAAPTEHSASSARAPTPKSGSGGNAVMRIIVALVFVVLVVGGAKLSGLF